MRPCNTSVEDFLKATIDIKYFELDHDVPKDENKYSVTATKEQFDEFFNKYDAVVYEYPDDMKVYGLVKFYYKKNPKRVMNAFIEDFYRNPYNSFQKVRNVIADGVVKDKLVEDKSKKLEADRLKREESLRESMRAENCELISKYTKANDVVYYLFEGFEYKTRPHTHTHKEALHFRVASPLLRSVLSQLRVMMLSPLRGSQYHVYKLCEVHVRRH